MIRKTANKLILAGFALFSPILAPAQPEGMDAEAYQQFLLASAQLDDPFAGQIGAAVLVLIVVIAGAMFMANQREKRKQELLIRFLDQGQAVPAELFPSPPSRQREIRRGVWLLSMGAALGIVLWISSGDWAVAAWSLIPLFLGAASFINAALFYTDNGPGRQAGNGR